jgi:hypothetical protein
LYLLHAINFYEAMHRCDSILDDDQEHMKVIIKSRLAAMIENADCNMIYKPAILRLTRGDATIFKELDVSPKQTIAILKNNKNLLNDELKKIKYPISVLGPSHLRFLENEHLPLVVNHAEHYVLRYARFLTQGNSGMTSGDMVNDLVLLALRAMRWYYPYLSGLHLTNTMRATITNRGRGSITYNVVDSRRRMFQTRDGKTINRESSAFFDQASNWSGYSEDPTNYNNITTSITKTSNKVEAVLAKFVLNGKIQDDFLTWLENKYTICKNQSDIITAVKLVGKTYEVLLADFYHFDVFDVKSALEKFRRAA